MGAGRFDRDEKERAAQPHKMGILSQEAKGLSQRANLILLLCIIMVLVDP